MDADTRIIVQWVENLLPFPFYPNLPLPSPAEELAGPDLATQGVVFSTLPVASETFSMLEVGRPLLYQVFTSSPAAKSSESILIFLEVMEHFVELAKQVTPLPKSVWAPI